MAWAGRNRRYAHRFDCCSSLALRPATCAPLQHTYVIISAIDVLSDVEDAEAQELEYVVRADPSYLETYRSSRKALDEEFDRLGQLVKNDPREREQVERVRYLVHQKLDELQTIIDARAAGFAAANATVLAGPGKQLMYAIRQDIGTIEEEELSKLAGLYREFEARLRGSLAALVGSTVLASCCLLVGHIVLAHNASRRERAEAELQASESRFETLCEQAPLGIYETDADGQCVYTNRKWSVMSGLSASESLGHGWKKALYPDDRERVFEGWQADAQRGTAWEYRLLNPQGETRRIRAVGGPIYSANGTLTGYVGTVEDVTESKQAVQALQDSEALNRVVLNSLPANIAVIKADGKIQAINEAWQRFSQLNGDPTAGVIYTGSNYLEACKRSAAEGSEDAQKALAGIQDVLAYRRPSFEMEYLISQKRWFHMLVVPLAGAVGSGAVISHVDITARKQAESALQQSRRELRALTGRLINAQEEERKRISRELHDDLSQKLALLAFDTGSLLQALPASVDEIKESLRNFQVRVVQLSQDVRRISHQLHPSILEDLGLTAALGELCEEFSAREGIEVQFEQEAMPKALSVDVASCLYRVAQEALHNVSKHARASHARLKVRGSPEGIHLCICDTGVGFDSEAGLSRPGLGIVSMEERVRLVHGEFSINSQPGQGTEVRVFVPLSRETG